MGKYKCYQDAMDAAAEARKRYDEKNTMHVSLKLNHKTDADIIHWLNRQPIGRQGAVKAAIRAYIVATEAETKTEGDG